MKAIHRYALMRQATPARQKIKTANCVEYMLSMAVIIGLTIMALIILKILGSLTQ